MTEHQSQSPGETGDDRSSKRFKTAGPIHEPARTSIACHTCRDRKVKCSGEQPCRYCQKRQIECVFVGGEKRKMYPISYVEDLERRTSIQNTDHYPPTEHNGFTPPATNTLERSKDSYESGSHTIDGSSTPRPRTQSSISNQGFSRTSLDDGASLTTPTIITDSTMSSNVNFGLHIKSLHVRSNSTTLHEAAESSTDVAETPDDAYNLVTTRSGPGDAYVSPKWPTEKEAQALLDSVLFSIGKVQHLFEPRILSDHMALVYENGIDNLDPRDLWCIELLLIFAIGELLRGNLKDDTNIPGASFFLHAIRQLPDLCSLRKAGIIAIEVMGLIAFYLQCSDRRDDAYVYAGTALRLAISNGMSRPTSHVRTTRSEKAHRNRLWWSTYMQERRLGAAAGHPLTIDDNVIKVDLPSEVPGFSPPNALIVNIKIARITGRVIQALYSQSSRSEGEFNSSVQEILVSLTELSRTMPVEYSLDFSRSLGVSRTSATLYLMLYQTMILATRPILLHLASSTLEKGDSGNVEAPSPSLQALSGTCMEAARRSLEVVCDLQKRGLLATFGFFDLDATFSVAFIFVLAERVKSGTGLSGVERAYNILQHLSERGNRAALKRQADIDQMCDHLSIPLRQRNPSVGVHSSPATASQLPLPISVPAANSETPWPNTQGQITTSQPSGISLQYNTAYVEQGYPGENGVPHLDFSQMPYMVDGGNLANASLWEETHDIYSSYHNNELALTGAVETDWEELERLIVRYQ